ncbi:hypothetical protein F444_14201 [Phytophthora nicotianae P1976]|nr:hypothetical protein F444_14201 [Phytophthora nicotianae P1976]
MWILTQTTTIRLVYSLDLPVELDKPGKIGACMACAVVGPPRFGPAGTGGVLSRSPGHGQPSQSPSSVRQVIPANLCP